MHIYNSVKNFHEHEHDKLQRLTFLHFLPAWYQMNELTHITLINEIKFFIKALQLLPSHRLLVEFVSISNACVWLCLSSCLQKRRRWLRVWRTTRLNVPEGWTSSRFQTVSNLPRCPWPSCPSSGGSQSIEDMATGLQILGFMCVTDWKVFSNPVCIWATLPNNLSDRELSINHAHFNIRPCLLGEFPGRCDQWVRLLFKSFATFTSIKMQ